MKTIAFLLFVLVSVLPISAQAAEDYSHFADLPVAQKEKIVRDLFEKRQFGKLEHKPICRYILEEASQKKDMYAGSGAYGHAGSAMNLAQSRQWKDLSGLIETIYRTPQSIDSFEQSFRCLRDFSGKPVSPEIIAASQTLRASGQQHSRITDAEIAVARQRLLGEPDKETVLVYAFYVATAFFGKGPNSHGREAGVDILATLDQETVNAMLQVFRDNFYGNDHSDLDWVAGQLALIGH